MYRCSQFYLWGSETKRSSHNIFELNNIILNNFDRMIVDRENSDEVWSACRSTIMQNSAFGTSRFFLYIFFYKLHDFQQYRFESRTRNTASYLQTESISGSSTSDIRHDVTAIWLGYVWTALTQLLGRDSMLDVGARRIPFFSFTPRAGSWISNNSSSFLWTRQDFRW